MATLELARGGLAEPLGSGPVALDLDLRHCNDSSRCFVTDRERWRQPRFPSCSHRLVGPVYRAGSTQHVARNPRATLTSSSDRSSSPSGGLPAAGTAR